jgi:hypothetical protein
MPLQKEDAMSTRLSAFFAVCWLAMAGTSMAGELGPGNGHSIRLGSFNGVVYYTVEEGNFRVVATLASGAEGLPIRFISTLTMGQSVVISVPQAVDQPSIDFEILRDGDALVVNDIVAGW